VLSYLEPRFEPAGTEIFQTLMEVRSIYFIVKGSVDVGFEVNRKPKYVVRLRKGGTFGIYNVTYDKKTMFNYRVKHDFQGFTIRKINWKILMWNPNYADIMKFVKK
jgi:CRP-like cAMP-binding protein